MLLKKKEVFHKKLMALIREYENINRLIRSAEPVKLDKPVQYGWKKSLRLRDDYTRRADAHVYQKLLDVCGKTVFSRNKKFLDRKGKVIEVPTLEIDILAWPRLGLPDYYKKYFYIQNINGKQKYVLIKSYWMEEYIEPYILTHRFPVCKEFESRKKEISNKLDRINGWQIFYQKLKGKKRQSMDYFLEILFIRDKIAVKELMDVKVYGIEE